MSNEAELRLDAPTIERFIAAFARMKAVLKRSGRPVPDADTAPDPVDGAEAQAIAASHGFATQQIWARVMSAIMLAYEYAQPDSPLQQLEANMGRAQAQIMGDTSLSAEEKQQMIAGMKEEHESMLGMRPPAEHVEAVRPFVPRIKALIETK